MEEVLDQEQQHAADHAPSPHMGDLPLDGGHRPGAVAQRPEEREEERRPAEALAHQHRKCLGTDLRIERPTVASADAIKAARVIAGNPLQPSDVMLGNLTTYIGSQGGGWKFSNEIVC